MARTESANERSEQRRGRVRRLCCATFSIALCARKERPSEFRGAATEFIGVILHGANSMVSGDRDTFQVKGLG
jgi:hypothetical protein